MMGYDRYPSFSPDGKKLAFCSMETPGYESDQSRLFLYDLEKKTRTYLSDKFDQDVASCVWDQNSKSIYFISGIKGTEQIYSIDIDSRNIKQITTGVHDYTSLCMQSGILTGTMMSMSMATEIFRIDPANGNQNQLTFTNKNIYDVIHMGKVEERWIKTTDNKNMLVWVIYPPDFNPAKKYPTLLYCEGGPQSTVSQFFSYRWNFQIMAANEYIIVAPQPQRTSLFWKGME